MKKVSGLTGAELDYWVARAVGEASPQIGIGGVCVVANGHTLHRFCPSTEWSHGGPIIERENLLLAKMNEIWYAISPDFGDTGYWAAGYVDIYADACGWQFGKGETPLLAAMRAYVAIKYGETVQTDAQEPDQ